MSIHESGLSVQHRDGGMVAQNPRILSITQFFDTALLLGKQRRLIDDRPLDTDSLVEGAFLA